MSDPRDDEFRAIRNKKLKASAPLTLAHAYLVDQTASQLLYYQKNVYRWRDGCYTELTNEALRSGFYRFLANPDIDIEPNQKKVSEAIDALHALVYQPEVLQPPCWLSTGEPTRAYIAFKNGLLKLDGEDGFELIDHNKDFFTTSACDYDYDPDAPPPARWLEFLNQLWGDDVEAIATLQEWFGLVLTVETRLQKMLLLIGPKRSGKGTIARVLRSVVGASNVAGPTLGSLGTPFGLSGLVGRSLAIIGDARLGRHTDEQTIAERLLSITGEDAINIQRKFLPDWIGQLTTRIMMLSNELPRIGDTSGALASRLVVLLLRKSFEGKEDRQLSDALIQERASIAVWALRGYARLMQRGDFVQPGSSRDAFDAYKELGSPMLQFIEDECVVKQGAHIEISRLYDAWVQWCTAQGRKYPGDRTAFGRNLRAAVPEVTSTINRLEGRRVRSYHGIGLSMASDGARIAVDRDPDDRTNRVKDDDNIEKRDPKDRDPPRSAAYSDEVRRVASLACNHLRLDVADFLEQLSEAECLQIDTGVVGEDEVRVWAEHFNKKFYDG